MKSNSLAATNERLDGHHDGATRDSVAGAGLVKRISDAPDQLASGEVRAEPAAKAGPREYDDGYVERE